MRRSVMGRIVACVGDPAACCDLRSCEREAVPPQGGAVLPRAALSLPGMAAARVSDAVVQAWARASLGQDPPAALAAALAGARRGASRLAKLDPSAVRALLGGAADPVAEFDSLVAGASVSAGEDGLPSCGAGSAGRIARALWIAARGSGAPAPPAAPDVPSVRVDAATEAHVAEVARRVAWAVMRDGGVADRRHRVYGPRGTRLVSGWGYELCGRRTAWLVSHARSVATSRTAAALAATYFFMLDDGILACGDMLGVDSVGCVGPEAGECLVLRFDSIGAGGARRTMEQVNGFGPERVEALLAAHLSGERSVPGDGPAPAVSHRGRAPRPRAPGRASADAAALASLGGSGAALRDVVSAAVSQRRGAVVPLSAFDEVDVSGGEALPPGDVRAASHVVAAMLRCAYGGASASRGLFGRQRGLAESLDALGAGAAASLGVPGPSAAAALDALVLEASDALRAGDVPRAAAACGRICWFNRLSAVAAGGVGGVPGFGGSAPEEGAALAAACYARAVRAVDALGGEVTGFDVECAPPGDAVIGTARAAYVTPLAVMRLTFSKGAPKAQDVLTDALCRHFGAATGAIAPGTGLAVANPRLGTLLVLRREEEARVGRAVGKLAAEISRRGAEGGTSS